MKKLFLIAAIALIACSKEEPETIQPIEQTQSAEFKTGQYEGEMSMLLHFDTANITWATRIISRVSDSTILIRWWSIPDTAILVKLADTLRYTYTADQTNNSCGNQRTVYDYHSTGFFQNDTLFESGTVQYRFFYNGTLRKTMNGTWQSWVKFKRK